MTCLGHGGSRAHTSGRKRGEIAACVAIVDWWLEDYLGLGKTVCFHHCCGQQLHAYLVSVDRSSFGNIIATSWTRSTLSGGYQCGWGILTQSYIYIYIINLSIPSTRPISTRPVWFVVISHWMPIDHRPSNLIHQSKSSNFIHLPFQTKPTCIKVMGQFYESKV